ncbi:hypothetical protein SAMN05216383_101105 [Prevotella sp. KH2C16]|nr:hypothetical protein SAMN05216383_101105 [Prevotella sp. KH2C16]
MSCIEKVLLSLQKYTTRAGLKVINTDIMAITMYCNEVFVIVAIAAVAAIDIIV